GGRDMYYASLDRRTNLYRLPIAANEARATGPLEALTDSAADDEFPSLSADGRFLAFSSNRQSVIDGCLEDLEPKEEVSLGTNRGGATLSPDGQRVVYSTTSRGGYVVQPVGGGAVQALPSDIGPYIWDWPTASMLVTCGTGDTRAKLHAFDLATGKL